MSNERDFFNVFFLVDPSRLARFPQLEGGL